MTKLAPARTRHAAQKARLVVRDGRDLLRALRPGSIDVLITDPPYATIDRHRSAGSHLKRWFGRSLSWSQLGRVLANARTRLGRDGIAFVMTNQAGLEGALRAMRTAGFEEPVRVIAWDKQAPGLGSGMRHRVEYVLVGRLAGSRALTGSDLVSVAAVGPNTAHRYPTQKPDQLGRALAKMARVTSRDIVVDPFCGSGALLVGAAERGATVIGSDVSPRAIALAQKRLTAAKRNRPSVAVEPSCSSLEGRRTAGKPASRNSARARIKQSSRRGGRR
jgi:site-specific DNA-methyltransferase (adenine-specific)